MYLFVKIDLLCFNPESRRFNLGGTKNNYICRFLSLDTTLFLYLVRGPRYRTRNSASLQVGQSEIQILVEARFSVSVQTDPEVHPASCLMGTLGKVVGRGVDYPPSSSANVVRG